MVIGWRSHSVLNELLKSFLVYREEIHTVSAIHAGSDGTSIILLSILPKNSLRNEMRKLVSQLHHIPVLFVYIVVTLTNENSHL